jgi:transcription termination factor Rho
VTDTIESTASTSTGGSTRGAAISTLRLPELQALAAELGVAGTSKMRKSDLVDAIKTKRAAGRSQATAPVRSTAHVLVAQPAAVEPERSEPERIQPERIQPERAPEVHLAPGETRDERAARVLDAIGSVAAEPRG